MVGSCTIQLAHDRHAFSPGDTVRGSARWQLSRPPDSVVVRLFWYTEGKGTQDVVIIEEKQLEASAQQSREFEFLLPSGPYSFSGKLISLTWAIELVCSGAEAVARETLTVSPSGQEIILGADT